MEQTPADFGVTEHSSWRPGQLGAINWMMDGDFDYGLLSAPAGCHAPGQGILMADGRIKLVENISVGEFLMGDDSAPREVLSLISGHGPMYRILPVKGQPFDVNLGHVLTLVQTGTRAKGTARENEGRFDGTVIDVSLSDWFGWSKYRKHIHKLFFSGVDVFYTSLLRLPIDPYFLGVLLGDGYMAGVSVTTPDPEIVEEIYRQASMWGLFVRVDNSGYRSCPNYYLSSGVQQLEKNRLIGALVKLGLRDCHAESKFVPHQYKIASFENRLDMIAGLLDTDGSYDSRCYDFISKSRTLCYDLSFLCRSVGLRATISSCYKYDQFGHGGKYWRACISGNLDKVPCRVARKKASSRRQKKSPFRTGFSVEPLGNGPYFGFELDGNGRYLLDDFTVTHNSGKSACAKALSSQYRTIILTETKSLQDQYGDIYHSDVLKGKSNYPCIHPKTKHTRSHRATCEDCLFSEKGMKHCDLNRKCPYLVAKRIALTSHFACLNYAYWMTSHAFAESHRGILVCDEAHGVPDQVINRAGFSLRENRRREYGLPPFPRIQEAQGLLARVEKPVGPSIDWITACLPALRQAYSQYQADVEFDPVARRMARRIEYLGLKLRATLEAFTVCEDEWFIESIPGVRFATKPLTARNHFLPFYAGEGRRILLMSATLGNPSAMANELGLPEGSWSSRTIPNVWPASRRPIYRLPVPRLSHRSSEAAYNEQADIISKAILSVPHEWSGIIHVTRKAEAKLLANRLARRGLQDRMWVTPQTGTSEQLEAWEIRKAKFPGSLMVSWSHHQGFDGLEEKICCTAKVQFPYLGDKYELRRFEFSKEMYQQRAAQMMEQSQGRTRRGREEDYDTEDERRGLNIIADENVRMIKRFFTDSFREALVKGMPE